jgi:micrococcal nuclease
VTRRTVAIIVWVWTVCGLGATAWWVAFGGNLAYAENLPKTGRVKAVFDGDTILLESGERVRYLGIDAPEVAHKGEVSDCYGDQARAANSGFVLHQVVRLEYDRESRDGYGRILAYVWLADGTCVNVALLRGGFAWLLELPKGFKHRVEFLEAQREALRQRSGMWSACSFGVEPFYPGNRSSLIFHRPNCRFGQKMPRGHRVRWENRWQALEQGYRPCRRCKP